MRKWICAVAFAILFGIMPRFDVLAAEYDYTVNGSERVSVPQVYVYSSEINRIVSDSLEGSDYLEQPQALTMGKDGNLYVADTGNSRVLKLTTKGELLMNYRSTGGISFKEPKGVYACEDGSLYIADTGNGRIVHVDASGTLIREYGLPEDAVLSDITVYAPAKIAPSPSGGLYVLMGENIMRIDENNVFQGFVGQTDVGFSFTDWLLRMIASDSQKKAVAKRTASNYISFCVNDESIIYATSYDRKEGEIKALNSVGNNIYRKYGNVDGSPSVFTNAFYRFFSGNIISKSFRFGELSEGQMPTLCGIAVDQEGIVTVIQKENGMLYQYDRGGNLLAVFGGLGSTRGKFSIPVDLTVDREGKLYVLDSGYGNIQVLEPTEFMTNIQTATRAYYDGDYSKASIMWQEVLKTDSLYPLAHYGIGMTEYKSENYQAAMKEFTYSNDRTEYSKAFQKYRYELLQTYFVPMLLLGAVLLVALFLALRAVCRKSGAVLKGFEYLDIVELNVLNGLWLAVSACFHPMRMLASMKGAKKQLNLVAAWIVLFLMVAGRVFFVYVVHYPLQDVELTEVDIVAEIVKLLLPVLTWTLAVYLITSQVDGEATLREIFIANINCMMPYVFVTPFAALLSRILCTDERMLFALLVNGVVLWMIFLLIRAVMILNDYTVGKTVAICLVSAMVMILLWFIAILGYTLISRIVGFVGDIAREAAFGF